MEDDSEVAVKRMFIRTSEDAKRLAENEKTTMSLMKETSPFVVNYHHCLMDNMFMYLVVDLCEESLKEYVESQKIEHLFKHGGRMIKEILTGLKFLHDKGILHRDLKPSNIMVDVDGHMRLADFGISRVLNEDASTFYTQPKGTENWMAAEAIEALTQNEEGPYKKKSDVQVAGMIAFYILTKGDHPFGARLERMTNIKKGKPANLKKLKDRSARDFVSWLISHKIAHRPYVHEALNHRFISENTEDSLPFQKPRVIMREEQ